MRLRGGSGRLVASIAGVAGLALGLFGLSGVVGSPAQAYAPVDQPGPALSVPTAVLNAAISCDQNPSTVHRDIILLVPPTLFDPAEAYGWNYEPAFRALGYPYCTVTFPDYSDGDVQVNGEYVVNAVRVLYGKSGRQVELFGWSQGASTAPRWALRWWPDIRPMVASLVGLAPVNEYGSDTVEGYCVVECIPAAWQQVRRITGASPNFMNALDSIQQTFPGIAYTVIYSLTDEVAGFNVITPAVSPLPPAPNVFNVATQQICPLQVVEHLDIPTSSAAYAVAIAALAHPGRLPNLAAIDTAQVCADPFMPYDSAVSVVQHEAYSASVLPTRLTTGMVTSEPPLACYVTNTCA
jgi:triacylglycerol esterase/lipase EstA (alpha/beta hydrolase family)